jgi:integrase
MKKTVTQFDENIAVTDEWEIISMLIKKYDGMPIGKSPNVFEDNSWCFSDAHADWLKVNFNTVFSGREQIALIIALKIIGYHLSHGRSVKEFSPKTISSTITDAKDFISWLIEEGYLVGETGSYLRPVSRLTEADFSLFFDRIASFSLTGFLGKIRILAIWHEMSEHKRLPEFMSLSVDPFAGISRKKVWEERAHLRYENSDLNEDDDLAWQPIPLNYAFEMVNEALAPVEDKRQEALDAHKIYMMAEEAGSDRSVGIKKLIKASPELADLIPESAYDNGKIVVTKIRDFLRDTQSSCIIIILATTGLRNWEVRDLRLGCCTGDPLVSDGYRLEAYIKKTSKERGKGKKVSLPIPKRTAEAIYLLEKIRFFKGPFLVEHVVGHNRVKRTGIHYINNRVADFCEFKGIEYIPHPHQFRKTIAGWFGMHSKFATLLIMRLFSHESAEMANQYLFNNPMIKEARLKILTSSIEKLIEPITDAALSGKMLGSVGEQLKESLENHPRFQGLTGEELAQELKQFLLESVGSANVEVLLTPLAVCVKDVNEIVELPCTLRRPAQMDSMCDLETRVCQFSEGIPKPEKCVGMGCSKALVIPFVKRGITQDLAFYKSLLVDIEEEQFTNVGLFEEAREFVRNNEIAVKLL